jgi:transcriptional regulator with XRE-family HTH domain
MTEQSNQPTPKKTWQEERRQRLEQANAYYEELSRDPEAWLEGKLESAAWLGDDLNRVVRRFLKSHPFPETLAKQWLQDFGKWLSRRRRRAGFTSLDQVVRQLDRFATEPGKKPGGAFSKSMLSLWERGKVNNLKPQTLWLLSQLYDVPYEAMIRRWVEARYQIRFPLPRRLD